MGNIGPVLPPEQALVRVAARTGDTIGAGDSYVPITLDDTYIQV